MPICGPVQGSSHALCPPIPERKAQGVYRSIFNQGAEVHHYYAEDQIQLPGIG